MKPRVYVSWIDSCSSDPWEELHEVPEVALIHSLGWLIQESPDTIILAMHLDLQNGMGSQFIAIPKVCLKEMKLLD